MVIFCYHGIGPDDWRFSVDFSDFKKQVDYLLKNFTPITGEELSLYFKNKILPNPAFVLTFDDGYKDIYQVKEYLYKSDIKPIVFILSDRAKAHRSELKTNRSFLSQAEILNLVKDGWSVGCHSATHPDFSSLTGKAIKREIIESKRELEKEFGLKINYFAYPKGKYQKRVLAAVKKAKFEIGFSLDSEPISPQIDPFKTPRIGIDRTYDFLEFKAAFSPSVVKIRSYLMNTFLKNYLME